MAILVIVACGVRKVWDRNPARGPTPARDAYVGPPFKVNRLYAERFGDAWAILSAKYGIIAPDFMIPGRYNVSFKDETTGPMSPGEISHQISAQTLFAYDPIIGLGGQEYRRILSEAFAPFQVEVVFPFAGLRVGKAMSAVLRAIESGRPFPTSDHP